MAVFTPQSPLDDVDVSQSGDEVITSYPTYDSAQHAVDRLANAGFPVQQTEIVGRNVRPAEQVTERTTADRTTEARAVMTGALTGAWLGILVGLFIGLFTFHPLWVGLIVGGLFIGSVWGGLLGFLVHRLGNARHDLASPPSVAARRYELIVAGEHADQARQLLSPLA